MDINTNLENQIITLLTKHFTEENSYSMKEGKQHINKLGAQGFNICINHLFLDQAFQKLLFDPANKNYWLQESSARFDAYNAQTGNNISILLGKGLIKSL